MGANMKHYTEDGLYDGPKHKMDDGSSHTGETHTKASRVISHNKRGPFNMKGYNYPGTSPMLRKVPNCIPKGKLKKEKGDPCWKNYVQRGTKQMK